MKKIIIALIWILINSNLKSQSISPAEGTEFCPFQEVSFTVTLPLRYGASPITVSGINPLNTGIQVTQIVNTIIDNPTANTTTFNFKGKFGDYNVRQTFRISYTPNTTGTPAATNQDFNFDKIKSLKNPSPSPNFLGGLVMDLIIANI
jgi:hypothetical protein